MSDTGSILLPPTKPPPVDPDPPEGDDFEERVPRPPSAWGVYVPFQGRRMSGFFGEGYMIPDRFPARGDAQAYVRRRGSALEGAKVVRVPCSAATLAELASDVGEEGPAA